MGGAGGRPLDGGRKRAGSPLTSGGGDPWLELLRLVATDYAYSTMYGVNIVDGTIISCANIQRTLKFGPEQPGERIAPTFDEYWGALKTLCGRVRNGSLAELKFSRGKPIGAKTSEGGRRFKRLLRGEA